MMTTGERRHFCQMQTGHPEEPAKAADFVADGHLNLALEKMHRFAFAKMNVQPAVTSGRHSTFNERELAPRILAGEEDLHPHSQKHKDLGVGIMNRSSLVMLSSDCRRIDPGSRARRTRVMPCSLMIKQGAFSAWLFSVCSNHIYR
jgi:hypothetical protein